MGIFGRKKQKQEFNIEISEGLMIGRPQSREKQNPFLSCVPKGILVYLIIWGSLGGFLSAFNVECNYIIPGIVLLVAALYFSGLFAFKNTHYKDIGYIIFFVIYVIGIYLLKAYVNSGFAAIVNMVRQRGEMYFELNTGTEFAENIEDRFLTVTIAIIFIGVFEVLLLNIFISNYMSIKLAVYLAIPMYIIPMYFEVEPDLFFVFCMLAGFMGVCVYKYNGHFKDGESRLSFEKEEKRKIPEISYTQNNRVYGGVLLCVMFCTLVVGIFTTFFSASDFKKYYTENKYKTATRDGVSGFIMIGFRIFFPNYYQRGGMSGGYLGNISALRPENETHLIVTFAPYDTNPVYLKGYTGLMYADNRWLDGYQLTGSSFGKSKYFLEESMKEEAEELEKLYKKNPKKYGRGVMQITNRAADTDYVYYPYFTKFENYEKYTENRVGLFIPSGINKTESFTYYPNINYEAEIKLKETDIYQMVPAKNVQAVDAFLNTAGISENDPDAVQKVVEYFQTEYSYSYSPGRVPRGDDFVNYFLQENKKGICSHFASAATLIFRRLGISARYVEGYAFSYSKVLSSQTVDGEMTAKGEEITYKNYYKGYTEHNEKEVRQVEVTDANAHAWVEIYQEGKGWIIVDPTPAVSEENAGEGQNEVLSSVRNFWENSPDINISGDLSWLNLAFLKSRGAQVILIAVGVLAVLILVGRFAWIRIYRFSRWHTRSLRKNMLWYYGELCRKKGKRDAVFSKLSVPSEQIAYMAEQYKTKQKKTSDKEEPDIERLTQILEKICFSPLEPLKEEYNYVMQMLRRIR